MLKLLASVAALLLISPVAHAGTVSAEDVQTNLNMSWVLTAAALVFFMQVGFLLLEAGSVRSKNSVNVSVKNFADFAISTLCFGAVGFAIMFGASALGGFAGWDAGMAWFDFRGQDNYTWLLIFFLFQVMFCGTAATILSGAVAERMQFGAYIWATIIIAALIYPTVGHWAWSNLLDPQNTSWLSAQGFIDFAGSTVVHVVGGAAALAAILVLGPRIGKFDENGKPVRIHGHSPVLATTGALILFIGWIGFNAGSTLAAGGSIAHIAFNTILAGCAGGVVGMCLGRLMDGLFATDKPINGTLAGLVGITAGCDVATPLGAITIGAVAAVAALLAAWWLDHRAKLDDAVGAVPVHFVGGIVGTLGVPFIAAADRLSVPVMSQFWVQLQGVLAAGLFTFAACYALFWALGRFGQIRVSEQDELVGLNEAEHGARLGVADLQRALAQLTHGSADLSSRVAVERGDENGELADQFNRFLAKLDAEKVSADAQARERQAQLDAERNAREAERAAAAAAEQARLQAAADTQRRRAEHLEQLLSAFDERMTQTINALADASVDLAQTAQVLGDGVERARAETDGIAATSASTVSDVGTVATVTEQLSETVRDITGQMVTVRAAATDAASRGSAGARHVQALREQAESMRAVMEFIQVVAGKTNLLSLNATIEAARAGEAGAGFRVVADEVKDLAKQTAQATEQVYERIDAMSLAVDEVVAAMQAIEQACSTVEVAAVSVAGAVAQQSDATQHISARAKAASEATVAIGDRIQALSATTRESDASAMQVERAVDLLAGVSRDIRSNFDELMTALRAA
jgi:ammonium transporter, Amt family